MIDLGVLGPAGAEDDLLPVGRGSRPRPDPWLAVLLLLVCCYVGVTAAAEPAPPARLVFSVPGVVDAPQVVGDSLLASVDGQITSYDLTTGAVRWLYDPPRRMQTLAGYDTVVVAPLSCTSRTPFDALALDARTGAQRWTRRGVPVWLVKDAPIVVIKQPVRGCSEATIGFDPLPSAPFTWLGIDVLTGAVRWELKMPAAAGLAAGVDGSGFVSWLAVYDAGAVTTYDLRTGTAVGTYRPPTADSNTPLLRVLGAGDQLLVTRRERNSLVISAFDAPDMRERWTSTVPLPGGVRQDLGGFFASWCGPTICLGPNTQTVGLDPLTGAERWRVPGRPARAGPGYGLFVRPLLPASRITLAVHDLASGVERVALRDADLLNRERSDPLLNRSGPGGRLWRLDLTDGRFRAVTVLPGKIADCDTGGRYLACRTIDGDLQVWKLPS